MKSSLLFLIFTFSISLFGQHPLTTQEVYNFQPGDRFLYEQIGGPGNRWTVEIEGKQVLQSSDSVQYRMSIHGYTVNVDQSTSPPTITRQYYSNTGGYNFYPYDALLMAEYDSSLYPSSDTCVADTSMYLGYCQLVVNSYVVNNGTCFEPVILSAAYASSLGQVHWEVYDPTALPVVNYGYRLVAYMRSGAVACGAWESTYLSTEEADIEMLMYPNPTHGEVRIHLHSPGELEIVNTGGQEFYRESLEAGEHSIDVSAWTPGVYWVRMIGSSNVHSEVLVVE